MERLTAKLLPKQSRFWMDLLKTVGILTAATLINAGILWLTGETNNVSELYVLAIFFISLFTNGYFWGFIASAAGVVGANFFFTYPYYTLNLSFYPLTYFIMMIIAVVTSTMASWVQEQGRLSKSRERKTQQINVIIQRLLCTQNAEQVNGLMAECLYRYLGRTVRVYQKLGEDYVQFGVTPPQMPLKREAEALEWAYKSRNPGGFGTAYHHDCVFWYIPLHSNGGVLAVVAIHARGQEKLTAEGSEMLRLLLSQFTMALERQRFAEERQQMDIEKQREQLRGNLLRAISHDLRTPLTGIIGASSAIMDNAMKIDEASQHRLLSDIHDDAEWLLRMVENVLSVTKLDQQANIRKVAEPVEEVVEQATKRCRKRYPHMQLSIHMPDELYMVPMDGTLIVQVLMNLIENAVRHSGNNAPIDLSVTREKRELAFEVRDHGKGIPLQDLSTLFDGFSSTVAESTDSTRGFGLGLSICKSIVTAHGGSIYAENSPDGGAIIVFTLPLEELKFEK